mgnify:CR=1 FL=1
MDRAIKIYKIISKKKNTITNILSKYIDICKYKEDCEFKKSNKCI